MAASKRKNIMMVSEGKLANGKRTKTAYYTTKGPQVTDKMTMNKFAPRPGQYEIFKEKKVPK